MDRPHDEAVRSGIPLPPPLCVGVTPIVQDQPWSVTGGTGDFQGVHGGGTRFSVSAMEPNSCVPPPQVNNDGELEVGVCVKYYGEITQ